MVSGDDDDITGIQSRFQFGQYGVDIGDRVVVTVRISSMTVNHVGVHEVDENETVMISSGSRQLQRAG